MQAPAKRPRFLHLLKIAMPVTAVASFAHRISGALLIAATPFLIYALEVSLRDPAGYASVHETLLDGPWRVAVVVLAWALAHHLLAGLRFLAQDLGIGFSLRPARLSAWGVNLAGLALLAFAVWQVWA